MNKTFYKVYVAILLAFILSILFCLLFPSKVYGQEVEKKELPSYQLFQEPELIGEDEGSTVEVEVPIYMLKNANIIRDSFYQLLPRANDIVMEVNEEIVPAYDQLYNEYERAYKSKEFWKQVAIYEGVSIATLLLGGIIYANLSN